MIRVWLRGLPVDLCNDVAFERVTTSDALRGLFDILYIIYSLPPASNGYMELEATLPTSRLFLQTYSD